MREKFCETAAFAFSFGDAVHTRFQHKFSILEPAHSKFVQLCYLSLIKALQATRELIFSIVLS